MDRCGRIAAMYWLVQKDLVREYRSRVAWPSMLLLAIVVAAVLQLQMGQQSRSGPQHVAGLFWIAVFFGGVLVTDRSFSAERDQGCWHAMLHFPISLSTVYLAKVAVNTLALFCLEAMLLPVTAVLCNLGTWGHPGALLLVTSLANVGIASVGTLLGALTSGLGQRSNLLAIVLLPLLIPVVLGASQATALMLSGDFGAEWWRWIQLLAAFAVVFTTAGILLFDFVIED